MEKCVRCGKTGNEIRLFDAIYDDRMELICERCSIIENVPIIKKPNLNQLKDSERKLSVYNRLKKMSDISRQEKQDSFFIEDRLKELDELPELELPERKKLNLINHYHWHIQKNRRLKKLSQEQLAEFLGEPVIVIKMVEQAKLPGNAQSIIRKLEQFFQIRLRQETEQERFARERMEKQKPILLKQGARIEFIPEEEIEIISEPEIEKKPAAERFNFDIEKDRGKRREIEIIEAPEDEEYDKFKDIKELNIRAIDPTKVKISDLKRLNRSRVEASRLEKQEEKRRIEDRRELIEARKEELRLMKEEEANEIDKHLQGIESLEDTSKDIDNDFFDEEVNLE